MKAFDVMSSNAAASVLLYGGGITLILAALFLRWRGRSDTAGEPRENEDQPVEIHRRKASPVAGTALFLAFLCGGLWVVDHTLYLKRSDGVTTMQNYYQQPYDSVDVLMLGSSKTGSHILCDVLWEEQGISSYNLWGSIQPLWNSYYNLNEALKYGRPKMVLLEISSVSREGMEYSDEGRQYTNTYGMDFSLNKLEAVQVSAPQSRWTDLLLGLPIYRERYSQLQQGDFERYSLGDPAVINKGSGALFGFGTVKDMGEVNEEETCPIPEKMEKYLLKIMEKCTSEDIPLVLFAVDSAERSKVMPYFNSVSLLAEEWDIPFINFNLLDNETGFTVEDFYKDNGHININGARKITSYLGEYLKEHYDLTDHRGDPYYSSWEEFTVEQENSYFPQITRMGDYLKEMLRDDREAVLVRWSLKDDNANLEALRQTAEEVAFDTSFLREAGDRCWVFRHTPDMTEYETVALDGAVDIPLGEGTLTIDPYSERALSFDGKKVCNTQTGLMCVIYDTNTGAIVDKCMLAEPSNTSGTVRHM